MRAAIAPRSGCKVRDGAKFGGVEHLVFTDTLAFDPALMHEAAVLAHQRVVRSAWRFARESGPANASRPQEN